VNENVASRCPVAPCVPISRRRSCAGAQVGSRAGVALVVEGPVGVAVELGAVAVGAVAGGVFEGVTFGFELPPPQAASASEQRSAGDILASSCITATTLDD
jgi:hypothetical protein